MEDRIQQLILEHLRQIATPERPLFLVGGAVRDLLLQRPVHDLDVVVRGETRRLANDLACRMHGALYVMDEERDTTRVILGQNGQAQMVVDFASLRSPDLEGDLRSRDFTINAMAYDVHAPDRLIDPCGGLEDLREKRIRPCSPSSLSDDPLRVLRMVRQAIGLGFRIDPETMNLSRAAVSLLPRVSTERKRDELFRMLDGPRVALAVRLLDQVGALSDLLPELAALKEVTQTEPHILNAWDHTLSVTQHLEQLLAPLVGLYREETVTDLTTGSAVLWLGRFREQFAAHYRESFVNGRTPRALLFMAALYHDSGKPETTSISADGRLHFYQHDIAGANIAARRARALALSLSEIQRLERVVENHMRVHHLAKARLQYSSCAGEEKLSRRTVYRFFRDAREAGVDICLLSLADTRGTYGVTLPQEVWEAELEVCRELLESYWEKREDVVAPLRLVTGTELIHELNLKPGRVIGKLIDAIREGQAAGEIHTREGAFEFSRRWLKLREEPTDMAQKENGE